MFCGKYGLVEAVIVLVISVHLCLGDDKKQLRLTGCGKTKGCYRTPLGCEGEKDCHNILTWEVKNDSVNFEVFALLGSDEKWTAVGLSYDQKMGNDSVSDCIYDDKNQSFIIQSSYNTNDPSNVVLNHNELGMVKGKSSGLYTNQRITCSFSRYITVRNDTEANKVFDLNSTYYIFLAKGAADDGVKKSHTTPPVIVPMMINTTSKKYQDHNYFVMETTNLWQVPGRKQWDSVPLYSENIALSGCGKTMGCYRVPSNCTGEEDCKHLLTWEVMNSTVNFAISSLLTSGLKWTAVGFSDDKLMGNDSVVDCIYNDTDQTIVIQSSYNTAVPDNEVLKNNQLGLVAGNSKGGYVDGRISCTFSHDIMTDAKDPEKDKVFSLNGTYYLFLARGPAMNGVKQQHTDAPAVSPKSVNVCDKNYPNINSDIANSALVKTHGSMMIIAWMLISSVAIMMPKYFKNAGPQSGLCGKAVWFQLHRLLMIGVFVLTCIAFIVIFVEVGGYTHRLSGIDVIHPIIGIIVTCLVVLNPILGLMRPSTDSPNRPAFFAAHKTLGTFAHLLAAVAMFLGTRLAKANMPYFTQWIVVGFAVWHLAVDHLLGVHHKSYQKTQSVISEPEHDREETEDRIPLTANNGVNGMKTVLAGRSATVFKTAVILGHIFVLLACSITLILNLVEK